MSMLTGRRVKRLARRSTAALRGTRTAVCCSALLGLPSLGAVAGCGGVGDHTDGGAAQSLLATQFEAAVVSANDAPNGADLSGGAWRVIEVPSLGSTVIVSTPQGWLALSSAFTRGDGKAPSGHESVLYRSKDGVHWTLQALAPISRELQLSGLAYGGGRYVMVGFRPDVGGIVWSSSDGEHWTESRQPPTGLDILRYVTYVHDRFIAFSFRRLGISETGQRWKMVAIPMVRSIRDTIRARYLPRVAFSRTSSRPRTPSIGPPGTPPLPDHVPRGADGLPLLSTECPVSGMLFCDDYEARTGCTCKRAAPRLPEYCGDVSLYRCAGRFTPRPGEWELDEVAQAGCSCNGVDPDQPL